MLQLSLSIFLIVTISFYILFIIIGLIMSISKIKNKEYSRTYNVLKNNNYECYYNDELIVMFQDKDKKDRKIHNIVFYRYNRTIKLIDGSFISKANYICPFDLYWGKKLNKLFDRIDPNLINRRNNKLKELGI